MKRLYMTVEGQTESAFATNVLTPHLASFDVFVFPPRCSGLVSRKSGRIPAGGLKNTFLHTLADMRNWMKQDRHEDARFTTMIDLYSIPMDFPNIGLSKVRQSCPSFGKWLGTLEALDE